MKVVTGVCVGVLFSVGMLNIAYGVKVLDSNKIVFGVFINILATLILIQNK